MTIGYGDDMFGKSKNCMRSTVSVHNVQMIVEAANSNLEGPIVRINPYEIHINDPEYIDEVYAGASKKRDKYRWVGNFPSECAARTFVNRLVSHSFIKQATCRFPRRYLMNSIAREGPP